MPSELKVNKLSPYTGTTLTLGDSGDTVSTDAVVQASQFVGGGLNAYRNLIINGDMSIAQRGTSVSGITSTGTGYNTVDRFSFQLNTAGTWTESQSTDVPSGQGFSSSLKIECTTANASLGAGGYVLTQQRIEGQNVQMLKKGTSNAESITISFWVKSNKTGTYILEVRDQDNTRHISQSYTINSADTWEKKILTYPGDTTGAFDNDNAQSLRPIFWLGAGSDFSSGTLATSWASTTLTNSAVGQVNLADSTSNYINFTGVQLEAGTSASDFEFLPYDVNLQRCQRYYQLIAQGNTQYFSNAHYRTSTDLRTVYVHPIIMRASPSLDQVSGTNYYEFFRDSSSDSFDDFNVFISNNRQSLLINNTDVSGTAGQAGMLGTDNASAYLALDSEL